MFERKAMTRRRFAPGGDSCVSGSLWGSPVTKSPFGRTRPRSCRSLPLLRLRHGQRSADADRRSSDVDGSDPPSRHASIGAGEDGAGQPHPPRRCGVAPIQQSRAGRPRRAVTGRVPSLRGDAEQPGGQPVGERVLRRLEAAPDTLPGRIACLGATRGGGAGGAQTRPAPNPQQAFGLPGRSQPRPSEPCGPGRPRQRGARLLRAAASVAPSVRTSWAPGCASAPLVDFAGVYGHDPRRQRCANHWQRTPARRTVRHVSARGISTGWSASPERARSMTRWATTSTASAAALWPPPTRSDSVKPTERASACHSARSASLERIFTQTARPALMARRFRFGVRGGTAPRQPLPGTR